MELNVMNTDQENAEGSNHILITNNYYANTSGGPNGLIPLLNGSNSWYYTISNNQFHAMVNAAISVVGVGYRVVNNTITDSYIGISVGGAASNDYQRPHDILISGNYCKSVITNSVCFYPPFNGAYATNVQVIGNTWIAANLPVSWNGGVNFQDNPTITYANNTEIALNPITPTTGIPGYTQAGALSGGMVSGGLSTYPMSDGSWIKSRHNYPSASIVQSFAAGDLVIANTASSTQNSTLAWLCTKSGTTGVVFGLTASYTSGSNIITVSTTGGAPFPHHYYTFGGSGLSGTRKLIWQISPTQWQVDGAAATATGSGIMLYSAPTWTTVPLSGGSKSGTCTFAASTCTVTFPTAFSTIPLCSAANTITSGATVAASGVSATGMTLTGTGGGATDTAIWTCVGNPN